MPTEIKIFLADDHPLLRDGLRLAIQRDARLRVIGEAADGAEAVERLQHGDADVAVLDIDMPHKDGFEVARTIREKGLKTEVIFLTMHKDERFLNAALDLGVKGYMLKDGAVAEIINCIQTVAAGHEYVSPQLTGFLLKRSRRAAALAAERPGLDTLTPTERRVLQLIAAYKTSKEIAEELRIGVRTVEHHRARICEKLELKGAHALIKFAVEHKSEI